LLRYARASRLNHDSPVADGGVVVLRLTNMPVPASGFALAAVAATTAVILLFALRDRYGHS